MKKYVSPIVTNVSAVSLVPAILAGVASVAAAAAEAAAVGVASGVAMRAARMVKASGVDYKLGAFDAFDDGEFDLVTPKESLA